MKSVPWGAVGAAAGTVSALAAVIALGPAYCNKAGPATQQTQDVHIDNSGHGSQDANSTAVGNGNVVGSPTVVGDDNAVVHGDISAPAAVGNNNKVTIQHIDQLTEQEE